MASLLNQIKDNEGARKPRTRVGRGIGSGKGKTCGRGIKGQKSRTGVAIKGFEGGQMPIFRRLPKRGFTNTRRVELDKINLSTLQDFIERKKIDASKPVTQQVLVDLNIVSASSNGVKLLGDGELKSKVTVQLDAASKSAIKAVEKAGGKFEATPYGDIKKAEKKAEAKDSKAKAPAKKSSESKAKSEKTKSKAA